MGERGGTVAATVKRGLVLLLVAFFLYWALSQPAQFADAVATVFDGLGSVLSAVGQLFDSLLRRLT
jgi:hypothetical protein